MSSNIFGPSNLSHFTHGPLERIIPEILGGKALNAVLADMLNWMGILLLPDVHAQI